MAVISNIPVNEQSNSPVVEVNSEEAYAAYLEAYQYMEEQVASIPYHDNNQQSLLIEIESKINLYCDSLQLLYQQFLRGKISFEEFQLASQSLKQEVDSIIRHASGNIKEQVPRNDDQSSAMLSLYEALQQKLKSQSTREKQSCYFDMGVLGSSIWSFIHWKQVDAATGYSEFDVQAFSAYLKKLFREMKQAGMNQINLSFIQLINLDAYLSRDFQNVSLSDVVAQQLSQFATSNVHFPKETNFLQIMTSTAHQFGMKVAVSCGGEQASAADFSLLGKPKAQAKKMAQFMFQYEIDAIDFDIEGSTANAFAHEEGVAVFFKTLHGLLKQENKTISLTTQGSLVQTVWGTAPRGSNPSAYNGPLKSLFYDENHQLIAGELFDDFNLMLYDSGTFYYLDAKSHSGNRIEPDWCVEDWLDIIGKNHAGKLHIGFQDATAYQNSASSASGYQYKIKPKSSSGNAAAEIYWQLLKELHHDGYTTPLGAPFWWPNISTARYSPTGNFISDVMEDFQQTLEQLSASH